MWNRDVHRRGRRDWWSGHSDRGVSVRTRFRRRLPRSTRTPARRRRPTGGRLSASMTCCSGPTRLRLWNSIAPSRSPCVTARPRADARGRNSVARGSDGLSPRAFGPRRPVPPPRPHERGARIIYPSARSHGPRTRAPIPRTPARRRSKTDLSAPVASPRHRLIAPASSSRFDLRPVPNIVRQTRNRSTAVAPLIARRSTKVCSRQIVVRIVRAEFIPSYFSQPSTRAHRNMRRTCARARVDERATRIVSARHES